MTEQFRYTIQYRLFALCWSSDFTKSRLCHFLLSTDCQSIPFRKMTLGRLWKLSQENPIESKYIWIELNWLSSSLPNCDIFIVYNTFSFFQTFLFPDLFIYWLIDLFIHSIAVLSSFSQISVGVVHVFNLIVSDKPLKSNREVEPKQWSLWEKENLQKSGPMFLSVCL
jgi:hypothetical protein